MAATTATTAATPTATRGPAEDPDSTTTSTTLAVIEYRGGATYVTGRIADFAISQGTITTHADGSSQSRDGTIEYRMISDDPRVAGAVAGTWNSDRWGAGLSNAAFVQWGDATLTTERGYWTAPYFGAFASPYGDVLTRWWVGYGELEGLTFYMWVAGSEVGNPDYQVDGDHLPG
jgi:hypothetical protein